MELIGRIRSGKFATWTKGSTNRGTPDIDAIINGRPVKIEVKVGKDVIRQDQRQEQMKIEFAGGLYYIARTMLEFLEWYEKFMIGQSGK